MISPTAATKNSLNPDIRTPSVALFIIIIFWVYTTVQHTLFSNGYIDFALAFHTADSIINSFLLPTLFFLSGIYFGTVVEQKKGHLTEFFVDRFIYVFVVWVFIQNISEVVFSGYTGSAAILNDIYFDFTSLPSNHLWLISAVLVNLLFLNIATKYNNFLFYILIFILSIAIYITQNSIPLLYPFNYLQEFFVFAVTGNILCNKYEYFITRRYSLAAAAVLFAVCQYIYHDIFHLQSYDPSFITLGLAFVGIFFALSISRLFSIRNFDRFNFAIAAVLIYLFYYSISGGMRIILQKTYDYSNTYGHLCLGVLAGIIIPLLLYRLRSNTLIMLSYTPPKHLSYAYLSSFIQAKLFRSNIIRGLVYSVLGGGAFFYTGVYAISEYRLNTLQQDNVPEFSTTKTDALDTTEGKRLATIYGCYISCHGSNLEGKTFHRIPLRGIFTSPNLTKSVDKYNDAELAMMIRVGLRSDGQPLIVGMPSAGYSLMPDAHLGAILKFLRSQPKIGKPTKAPSIGFLTRLDIAIDRYQFQHTMAAEITSQNPNPSHGERWVKTACTECHGNQLQGSSELGAPPLIITRAYSFTDFKKLLQEGVNLSGTPMGLMTSVAQVRFSNFTEDELRDIYTYLTTL